MKPGSNLPSYLETARSGELHERVRKAVSLLSPCRVCPHKCKVDRDLKPGYCSTGSAPSVAAWTPHFGEEPPLSGTRGSGTIFLRSCNLRCVYCQNHQISQPSNPDAESLNLASNPEKLAEIFLELQQRGCHNLNWVSPSHQAPQLLQALELAIPRGLNLPIVYNTMGGISEVDIRLPRAAMSFGVSKFGMLWKVILPAAMPQIFTGMKVAIGITWLMVVAAEMIASKGGLGYWVWYHHTVMEYPMVILGMGIIGLCGALCSVGIDLIGNRMMKWRNIF